MLEWRTGGVGTRGGPQALHMADHPPYPHVVRRPGGRRWHLARTERVSGGALDTALKAGGMPPAAAVPPCRLIHASSPTGTPADGPVQRSNGACHGSVHPPPPTPPTQLFSIPRVTQPLVAGDRDLGLSIIQMELTLL